MAEASGRRSGADFARLAARLVSWPGLAPWVDQVAALPCGEAPLWDSLFLESPLAGAPGRVDFLAGLASIDGGGPPDLDGPWRASPALAAWRPDGALAACPLVWFEWDRSSGRWAEPLCWIGLSSAPLAERGLGDTSNLTLARAALGALVADTAPYGDTIERCVEALQGDGELLHMGSLAPRGLSRLRLSFAVRAHAVAGWLSRIGWPGETRAVGRSLFEVEQPYTHVGVQVELTPGVGSYLGVECQEYRTGEHAAAEAADQIAAIAALAPVARDPTDALRAWAGEDESGTRHGYVKLVREPGGWSAKLYLGFTRR